MKSYHDRSQNPIRDNLIVYIRSKMKEVFNKGPGEIKVEFSNSGIEIDLKDLLSKYELSLLKLDDRRIVNQVVSIRQEVHKKIESSIEDELSNIINRNVVISNFDICTNEKKAVYHIKYLDSNIDA